MSSKTVHLLKHEKPEAPSRLADNDSAFSPEALNHNGTLSQDGSHNSTPSRDSATSQDGTLNRYVALSQDGELSSNSNGGNKNFDKVIEPASIRVALA